MQHCRCNLQPIVSQAPLFNLEPFKKVGSIVLVAYFYENVFHFLRNIRVLCNTITWKRAKIARILWLGTIFIFIILLLLIKV